MSNPTSPGWYDDPQDPTLLRYFDGIVWTRHATPRAGIELPAAQPHAGQVGPTASAEPAQEPPPLNPYGVSTHTGSTPPPPPWSQPPAGQQPGGDHPGPWSQPPGYQHPMTQHGPTAPDGTPLASYLQRVGAWFIDGIIKLVISLVLGGWAAYLAVKPQLDAAMTAAQRGETVPRDFTGRNTDLHWLAVYLLVFGVVGLAYSVFFLTRSGATPGKSALGISVRRADRPGPLDARTAAVRYAIPFFNTVLGVVPVVGTILSLLWVADSAFPLWQPHRQAIHDLMAGTLVVLGPQPSRP